ncbi:MAG TPA: site-specific DNA-methyltransferase [Flavobacteriales bacterium]|nr:site-specific DNA-methyltransferase [Flavobacteriales bacterium]
MSMEKTRAGRNRTITLSEEERASYGNQLVKPTGPLTLAQVQDHVVLGDTFAALGLLPDAFVDLLFVDPPYNMDKVFGEERFKEMNDAQYAEWLDAWVSQCVRLLKPDASVYICGDWKSSSAIQRVAEKYFVVRNRITWEREKGRGALSNWKNSSEDIWFCTMGKDYHFDAEAVKLKRKVVAPYTDESGAPKDWERSEQGSFRLTHPSNLWTDLTVPFWSMPENTDHPTQKPEKLVAKAILASSRPGDVVFDPFLGSGTTAVVAKKLGRHFVGIEIDENYACLAQKRLAMAEEDPAIQGYVDGVFWERNSGPHQQAAAKAKRQSADAMELFPETVNEA